MFSWSKALTKGQASSVIIALLASLFVFFPSPSEPAANATTTDLTSSVGNEFWITFNGQTGTNLNIYISSTTDTVAKVTWPDGTSQSYSVSAGLVTTVDANAKMLSKINQGLETTAYNAAKITAPDPITVYTINYRQYTTDASNAIPTEGLGKKYFAVSYRPSYYANSEKSRFSIIAVESGSTTVTISPTVALNGNRSAGVPYTITLQQGQVYSNIPVASADDTSGTYIVADKKIAVSTATYLNSYNIAGSTQAADNIFEQMTPVESWGTNFVGAMSIATTGVDFYRVIAAEDGTTVTVNDSTTHNLNAGQLVEFSATSTGAKADRISSSKPIMLLQYIRGGAGYVDPANSNNTATGDPAFFVVPPTTQFINDYIITTPASGFNVNSAVIVAPKSVKSTLTRGGVPIGASAFTDIPSSSYAVARVSLTLGAHYFRAAEPFSIAVMGFTSYDSYAYTGGYGLVQTPGGYVAAQSSQSPTAPFSVGGDKISGNPGPCGALSITEGSWTDGRSAITNTSYQWLKDGADISGATTATLSLDASYLGSVVSAKVTKTNSVGQTSAFTNQMEILDTRLNSITLSSGVLSPSLTACGTNYVVATTASVFSLSPTLTSNDARIKVSGSAVLSGGWSNLYQLAPGANSFELVATNASASHTISLTVNRTSDPVSITTVPTIGINDATISGVVQPNGNAISSVEFELDSNSSFASPQIFTGVPNTVLSTASSASANAFVNGLTAGSRYYYRLKIISGGNTYRSETYAFTTLAAPSVESVEFVRASSTSATAKMNIYPQSQPISRAEFYLSEDSEFSSGVTTVSGTIDNSVVLSNGGKRYNHTFTGLTPGKTYYMKPVGENTTGENFGARLSVILTSTPEVSATASPEGRTVTFRGTVDPNAVATSNVVFEYGTNSGLSSYTTITAVPSVITGDGPRDVAITATGLTAATTYYFRIKAVNSSGTTTGVIQSFQTPAATTPTVEIIGPSSARTSETVFISFRFSEPVTGFDKSKVSLTGSSSGWVTQPTTQISSQLYSMEIRPNNPSTGSFTVNVATGAGLSAASVNSAQPSPLTINVTNLPATSFSYSVSSISLVVGEAMSLLTPSVSGTTPTGWGVTPNLPAGLQLASNGVISGTPTAAQTSASYTIRAIGGIGSPTFQIVITISAANSNSGSSGGSTANPRFDGINITRFSTRSVFSKNAKFEFFGDRLADLQYVTLGGKPLKISKNTDAHVEVSAIELPVGTWDLEMRNANGQLTYGAAITVLPSPIGKVAASFWRDKVGTNTLRYLKNRGIKISEISTIVCYANVLAGYSPESLLIARTRAAFECEKLLTLVPKATYFVREKTSRSANLAGKISVQLWSKK